VETIRVLYVEDDPGDRELTRRHLERHAPHLTLQLAGTVGEALDQLDAGNVDVVLSDYRLPDATGLDLLEAVRGRELMVPVILVTGSGDAEAAVRLLKAGAADYVVKRSGHLDTLPPIVEGAFRWSQSVRELRRTTIRVLHAEHDPADVELIRRAFREHGPHFQLEVAWRARDVLERLRAAPYDLLLLDYRMPDRSGIEVLKALREERIRIPVVMMTGQGDEETAVQAFKLGAADYIIKRESDLPKLPSTLENVLAQRRLADEKDALLVLNGQRTQAQLLQTEKLAAMGQLLAGVAHELNNPLAVVMGRTALLSEQLAGSPLVTQAEKIAQAAERSARIVRNFLALARQRPPERQRVHLNHVVREAVELLAYQLQIDSVEVVFDLATDLPALWADLNQLHQVIVNLVSNAHHALRARRPPRRVTMTTRVDAARSRVSLVVADNGPGISVEVQDRIFEPFFTTKPTGQGTGLGLSLCRGILEGHGGSIRVESAPGQGATFRVELPAAAPPTALSEAPAPTSARPMPGLTILVADDEPEVADMLAEILSADGHRVDTVANGVAALERLGDRAYDLILSDVKMPDLDGPGLYRELERRHPALVRRIVLLTGDTLSPEINEFLERSGVPSLNKPFARDEIRRVIQRVGAP